MFGSRVRIPADWIHPFDSQITAQAVAAWWQRQRPDFRGNIFYWPTDPTENLQVLTPSTNHSVTLQASAQTSGASSASGSIQVGISQPQVWSIRPDPQYPLDKYLPPFLMYMDDNPILAGSQVARQRFIHMKFWEKKIGARTVASGSQQQQHPIPNYGERIGRPFKHNKLHIYTDYERLRREGISRNYEKQITFPKSNRKLPVAAGHHPEFWVRLATTASRRFQSVETEWGRIAAEEICSICSTNLVFQHLERSQMEELTRKPKKSKKPTLTVDSTTMTLQGAPINPQSTIKKADWHHILNECPGPKIDGVHIFDSIRDQIQVLIKDLVTEGEELGEKPYELDNLNGLLPLKCTTYHGNSIQHPCMERWVKLTTINGRPKPKKEVGENLQILLIELAFAIDKIFNGTETKTLIPLKDTKMVLKVPNKLIRGDSTGEKQKKLLEGWKRGKKTQKAAPKKASKKMPFMISQNQLNLYEQGSSTMAWFQGALPVPTGPKRTRIKGKKPAPSFGQILLNILAEEKEGGGDQSHRKAEGRCRRRRGQQNNGIGQYTMDPKQDQES